jgi:hypothetical protein
VQELVRTMAEQKSAPAAPATTTAG